MPHLLVKEPDAKWNVLFQLAEEYYQQNHHLLIPGDFIAEGHRLGRWIQTQRTDYHKRTNPFFSKERINRLEAIGMVWDVKEYRWQDMLAELTNYKKIYGNAGVPQDYVTLDGKTLGIWLNCQRMLYKKGTLLPERQELLENLGVIWNPQEKKLEKWEENYQCLKTYLSDHNGKLPPVEYAAENGVKLRNWLNNQKGRYRSGKLLLQRQKKLIDLGVFDRTEDDPWEQNYEQAMIYYREHGHLGTHTWQKDDKSKKLREWLTQQRSSYRRGDLSEDRIQRLEEIGMVWNLHCYFLMERYKEAESYYRKYGHLQVPKSYITPGNIRLGEWISSQRNDYHSGTNRYFTEDRIRKLEAIGMIWDASIKPEEIWENWYEKAKDYYQEHGNLLVPKGKLRTWLFAQRGAKHEKRGCLSTEKIHRLEQIGMVWEPLEVQWQEMYSHAKRYYEMHGMLNVPATYVTQDGARLGQWISAQRTGYRNVKEGRQGKGRNVITPEHIELLNQIHMIWSGEIFTAKTSRQEKIILYYLKKNFPDAGKMDRWQKWGIELDIYLPSLRTAIEYDGVVWHQDKREQDEKKGWICRENGIRLIRIREPGLPAVLCCDFLIDLEEQGDSVLENALKKLFVYLECPCPDIHISEDISEIYAEYKDYVSHSWDRAYEAVFQYYEKFGRLPDDDGETNDSTISLINWIRTQREAWKNDELTPLQIEKLEKIGMEWEPYEKQWMMRYYMAEQYFQSYGHLNIPADYCTDGVSLGSWLVRQRSLYRQKTLSPRRIHLLERLGIVWAFQKICTDVNGEKRRFNEAKWHYFYQAARKYYMEHGHLHIPSRYENKEGVKLGNWLADQRKLYHEGKMNPECVQLLEDLNIQWKVFAERWEEMFAIAKKYSEDHGGLDVSPDYVTAEGVRLGGWISKQRSRFRGEGKNSRLTEEQKECLDAIGMIWDPYEVKWMKKYRLAKEFYQKQGHLRIPSNYITESGVKLGMWIGCQRQAMCGNPNYQMTERRKNLLDEIGMCWNV